MTGSGFILADAQKDGESFASCAGGDPSTPPLRGSAQDDKMGAAPPARDDKMGAAPSARDDKAGAADEPDQCSSIVFDNVSFAYRDDTAVLKDISFSIASGEFVAVLGANGSGKSTLARHINALLLPHAGRVLVDGIDTADASRINEIRRTAGMVFQNPDNQAVASVVRDDVAFGPENLGLPPEQIAQRVDDALKVVAMQDFADSEIYSLSGGQKQRVAIAGVLAMHPQILILDEPGAMLDVRGRRGITRVAHELNREGMTVILITHFMEDALGADRVIVLDRGSVALSGTPQEVFTSPKRLRELRLELPFSVRLAEDLRKRGIEVGLGLSEERLEEELCQLLLSR